MHFQSSHSWIGVVALAAFTMQWLSGLVVFFTPLTPTKNRAAYVPTHAFVGAVAIFGGLLAIVTGILSLAYRGDNASGKDLSFKVATLLALALAVAIALTLAPPLSQPSTRDVKDWDL